MGGPRAAPRHFRVYTVPTLVTWTGASGWGGGRAGTVWIRRVPKNLADASIPKLPSLDPGPQGKWPSFSARPEPRPARQPWGQRRARDHRW